MNKFLKQLGFLIGAGLIIFAGYWMYLLFFTVQETYITIDGPNHVFGIDVPFDLTVTIHNHTAHTITETFSSACTDPTILINDKQPNLGLGTCSTVITEVSIRPYSTRKYTINVPGDNKVVHFGSNAVKATWGNSGDVKAGEFTFLIQR